MTREELIAYDRWLTENKWGSSEIITPEQAADLYLAEHPLPPVEGAEEILRKNCNTCYSRSTGEEEVWSSVSSVLIAMQDFATLHAQRIAEKMVSENLVEFGNMIRDEPNGDIAALAEYFIRTINLESRK